MWLFYYEGSLFYRNRRKQPDMKQITILLGTMLLAGCTTMRVQQLYEGSPRGASEIARILVPSGIEIGQVDGSHIMRTYALPGGDTQELHVLPGKHVLKGRYAVILDVSEWEHISFKSDFAQFAFTAQAGQTYEVKYEEPAQNVIEREISVPIDIWIVDANGNRISEKVAREIRYARAEPSAKHNPSPQKDEGESGSVDSSTLIQLKAWWMGADEEAKSEFLDWIRDEK